MTVNIKASGRLLGAPDVLLHLHIPKTGGMSLNSMIKHAFREDQIFDSTARGGEIYTGLSLASYECCRTRLLALAVDGYSSIRYVSGHIPMGLHHEFTGTTKYFTVVRHPVERVISYFYFMIQMGQPLQIKGRPLAFEEFIESDDDINLNNYQVRVVSGCPELDADAPAVPGITPGAPVEARHLDLAKQNIEDHFLVAAPINEMVDLALIMRSIYGWPMRRLQTEFKNLTKSRPRQKELAPDLIRKIEIRNSYDIELYNWVCSRFSAQKQLFEPKLTQDRRIFTMLNRSLNTIGQVLPRGFRKRIAEVLFYA